MLNVNLDVVCACPITILYLKKSKKSKQIQAEIYLQKKWYLQIGWVLFVIIFKIYSNTISLCVIESANVLDLIENNNIQMSLMRCVQIKRWFAWLQLQYKDFVFYYIQLKFHQNFFQCMSNCNLFRTPKVLDKINCFSLIDLKHGTVT